MLVQQFVHRPWPVKSRPVNNTGIEMLTHFKMDRENKPQGLTALLTGSLVGGNGSNRL